MYELGDSSSTKNQRLKSIRLIELSDHITRLNRRENAQLDLRLRQLQRQATIIQRGYERDIYWKRLQLEQIHETLNESFEDFIKNSRVQTPMSFYAIKMRRNQSAPPNTKRTDVSNNNIQSRPNTTATPIRRTKRAMSVFKEITLKPSCRTLGNMLILLDHDSTQYKNEWPMRPRTTLSLRKDN